MATAAVYPTSSGSSPAARMTSFHLSAVVASPIRPHAFIKAEKDSMLGVILAACEFQRGQGDAKWKKTYVRRLVNEDVIEQTAAKILKFWYMTCIIFQKKNRGRTKLYVKKAACSIRISIRLNVEYNGKTSTDGIIEMYTASATPIQLRSPFRSVFCKCACACAIAYILFRTWIRAYLQRIHPPFCSWHIIRLCTRVDSWGENAESFLLIWSIWRSAHLFSSLSW